MPSTRIRLVLGSGLLFLAASLLLWGIWPHSLQTQKLILNEDWQMALDWPRVIRAGDEVNIRLSLLENSDDSLLTMPWSSPVLARRATLVNMVTTNTDYVLAEARLELGGIVVTPYDIIRQRIVDLKAVDFFWRLRSFKKGIYRGTLWLYLEVSSDDGRLVDRQPILARDLQIESNTFLGLNGLQARIFGGIGVLAGLLLLTFSRKLQFLPGEKSWILFIDSPNNPFSRKY